nr:MAG TPA: hypothetical protein [Caudoviricetes sp.]
MSTQGRPVRYRCQLLAAVCRLRHAGAEREHEWRPQQQQCLQRQHLLAPRLHGNLRSRSP